MAKVRKLTPEEQEREDDRQTFSKMRRTLGVRQAELSKATGIDQAKLSRWENGHIEITPEETGKIVKALDAALVERSEKGIPLSLGDLGYLEPSTSSKNLGKSYAEWRRKNSVTQQEVVDYINTEIADGAMSASSISAFENGYCDLDKDDWANLSHALIELVNKKRAAAGFPAVESRWRETFAELRESGREIAKLEREKAIQARQIEALRGEVAAQAEQIAALRDLLDLKTKEVLLRDKIESEALAESSAQENIDKKETT